MSDTLYREHLRPLQPKRDLPYKFLSIAILLLMYLPSMIMITLVVPPQVEFTSGNEVDNTTYCEIRHVSEAGVTRAVLLNNTPFSPSDDWEIDTSYSYDYDFNRFVRNESDGYHLQYPPDDIITVAFSRTIQIPLFNYSDISIAVEIEGVSGSAGIYLEVFAEGARAMTEAAILAGETVQVNASAPLIEARQYASSWLGSIVFHFQTASAVGAQIIVRSVVVEATLAAKLSRVQLDIQSTENISLYQDPWTKYLQCRPRIMIVQNNDSSSAAVYMPVRVNDEIYLPPGIYEGMVFWVGQDEHPDPTNATSWAPNVNFTVLEDDALEIDVRIFAVRVDIDLSHRVLLASLGIYFLERYQYLTSSYIVGSTLYYWVPDYFYIPSGSGLLVVEMTAWSPFSPHSHWYPEGVGGFRIRAETYLDSASHPANLRLSIVFPYVAVGDAVLGAGEFALLATIAFLLIGFAITLHRMLQQSDLRHRLSDSRLLPIILLGLGIFLPWSIQLPISAGSEYVRVYWISWFSMPFMIRWSDSTAVQLLCSTPYWSNASIISTLLLIMPLFYACQSLSYPETHEFNRRFCLALFLPYLLVLTGFSFSVLSIDSISVGPLLTIAALPVWLMRIALRRLGLTR